MAKYTDKQAQDKLKRLIDEIDNVRKKPRLSPKFKAWQAEVSELLERIFGRSSKQVKEFDRIPYSLAAFSNQTPDSKFDEAFQQGLKTAAIMLSSAVKDIQNKGAGEKAKQSKGSSSAPQNSGQKPSSSAGNTSTAKTGRSQTNSKSVLLFATQGGEVKREVQEFFTKLGFVPVVVSCKTIEHDRLLVEVEKNDEIGYALVLLGSDENKRANDNAYGLGLLVGAMGRDRVCVLTSDKLKNVSSYSGITNVTVDAAGAWKFMMIKHLKIAGFGVDANLAL